MKNKLLLVIIFLDILLQVNAEGFLKRDSVKIRIVDGSNNEFLIRGIGLGGWMLQEGYMLNMSPFANAEHQIREKIVSVLGEDNTNAFYDAWLKNYMQEVDVDSLKSYGFNSIRLPLHYNLFTLPIEKEPVPGENTWINKGFELTDSLLKWCKKNQMYLILDMHATPGGQGKDAAVSDYDTTKPSLWESTANQDKLVALWRRIAEHYSDEEWIGGYDLINEINWDVDSSGNQYGCNCMKQKPIGDLYQRLITAIREVDTNHLLILEGNCWGNRYNGFLRGLTHIEKNMVVSFHKYWNYNDQASISTMLSIMYDFNIPLWCGESGENSNTWNTEAINLFEKNGIGWSWWTYKKFSSITGINSVVVTPEYNALLDYWRGWGTKPTVESATATMMQMAENLKLENCVINHNVVDALIRLPNSTESKLFTKLTIPGTVFAVHYDMGRSGIAYSDKDTANYSSVSHTYTDWNLGWSFRNDGVDIDVCNDTVNTGYYVGWTNPGEWISYTVNVDSSMIYKLKLRYASGDSTNAVCHFSIDGKDESGPINITPTGAGNRWKSIMADNILIKKGTHLLKIHFDEGEFNVNYLKFEYSRPVIEVDSAYTSEDGKKIFLHFNSPYKKDVVFEKDIFQVVAEDTIYHQVVIVSPYTDSIIEVDLADSVLSKQKVTISYEDTSIVDTANKVLEKFTNLVVQNKRPNMFVLPLRIQGENYYNVSGLNLETCEDEGGGQTLANSTTGDYADYYILNNNAGTFQVNFRIAAIASGGIVELQLLKGNQKTLLGSLNVPATGGWQKYSTISTSVDIPKGEYLLRVFIKKAEYNINWFEFNIATGVSSAMAENELKLFPNPAKNEIKFKGVSETNSIVSIYTIDGRIVLQKTVNIENSSINIQTLKEGLYYVKMKNKVTQQSCPLLIKR